MDSTGNLENINQMNWIYQKFECLKLTHICSDSQAWIKKKVMCVVICHDGQFPTWARRVQSMAVVTACHNNLLLFISHDPSPTFRNVEHPENCFILGCILLVEQDVDTSVRCCDKVVLTENICFSTRESFGVSCDMVGLWYVGHWIKWKFKLTPDIASPYKAWLRLNGPLVLACLLAWFLACPRTPFRMLLELIFNALLNNVTDAHTTLPLLGLLKPKL